MVFLIVLVLATAGVALVRREYSARDKARVGLGLAMAFAGFSHLVMPEPFVQHLPDVVPLRTELIYATGLVEMALGAAMIGLVSRRVAVGLALAAYLVAVFPSNVYVAVADIEVDGQPGGLYAWLRLPFQALFVWLAVWSTGGIEAVRAWLASRTPRRFAIEGPFAMATKR